MLGHQVNEHKHFTAAIDSSAKEVDVALSRRQEDMGQEWNDIDKGWQDLQEKMADIGITKLSTSDKGMMWLNVGGLDVSARRSVFTTIDGSSTTCIMADLFQSGTWDQRLPRDSDGRTVLDESPACVKHIVHTLLKGSGKGNLGTLLYNDAPADEKPILCYVCRALGLAVPVVGMVVTGGSTILQANAVGLLTTTIQGWCPGQPKELRLLYRASRDGWTAATFHARCRDDSPSTITLFRVQSRGRGTRDSIVGGFSSVPWTPASSNRYQSCSASPGAFLFMLDNGSAGGSTPFQPVKWGIKNGQGGFAVYPALQHGPYFGAGPDLSVGWSTTSSATLIARNSTYDVDSVYLSICNLPVLEIETFMVCSTQPLLAAPLCSPMSAVADPTPSRSTTAYEEEHSNDIRTFGELIAGSLMEERMALHEAQIELVEAGNTIAASANALEAVYGPDVAKGNDDPVVELSVRGSRVTTLLSTLHACPESVLATMFNEDRWPATDKDVDEHGRRLIDCSPSVFAKVLDVLRMRKRTAWAGIASQRGCGTPIRVIIKAGDRDPFEEFVEKHFPGDLQSFIMDCVEPAAKPYVS